MWNHHHRHHHQLKFQLLQVERVAFDHISGIVVVN